MIRTVYLPDPCLSNYISHYMHLEITIREADRGILCSFPNGICLINIIYSDDLPEFRFFNNKTVKTRSFLSGVLSNGLKIHNTGTFRCLLVYFTPLGAFKLFKVPQAKYVNTFVHPELLTRDWNNLEENVCQSTPICKKIKALNNYFSTKLFVSNKTATLCEPITSYIYLTKGKLKMDEVISRFGTTPRTLDRIFNSIIGLPPKAYSKLVRLGMAYQLIMFNPELSIHDIIYLLGFYDQSHLSKEFAEYADLTPAELKYNSPKALFPKILTPES